MSWLCITARREVGQGVSDDDDDDDDNNDDDDERQDDGDRIPNDGAGVR